MEIFKFNRQQHPDDRFFPYLDSRADIPPWATRRTPSPTGKSCSKNIPPGLEGIGRPLSGRYKR